VAAAVVVAAAAPLGAGCETAKALWADADKPTASVVGVALQDFDLEGATLAFDVEVGNPYGVALPTTGLDLALSGDGRTFLHASSAGQGAIPARSARVLPVSARLKFADLLAAFSKVRPGSTLPYAAEIGVSVDAPAVGAIRIPVRKEGELPIPTAPDVEVEDVKWSKLSLTEATAEVRVDFRNRNEFPMDLRLMDGALSLGGTRVAQTRVAEAGSFAAGEALSLRIPISLRPADLGLAVFRMLSGAEAAYEFDGGLVAGTPFGDLKAPLRASGRTPMSR